MANGLFKADPFFKDIQDNNLPTISSINDLRKVIIDLKNETQKAMKRNGYDPWGDVRHNLGLGIYFRGESDREYELRPQIGRMVKEKRLYEEYQERNVLHRFRCQSYAYYQRILTDWEAIFLAQHHGLPTRLLDWTRNQLVALFWACQNKRDSKIVTNGGIYAFVRQPDENWDLNVFNSPLHNKYKYARDFKWLVKGVKVIYPFHVSPRITAHGGLFTIQDDPYKRLNDYSPDDYSRKDFDILLIRKWEVPKRAKKRILKELDEIGINIHTLYTDLNALTKRIKATEETRWLQ